MAERTARPRWLAPIAGAFGVAVLGSGLWLWQSSRQENAELAHAQEVRSAVSAVFAEAAAARRRNEAPDPGAVTRRARERIASEAEPRDKVAGLTALGGELAETGRAEEAEAVLNEAVDLARAELGDTDPATAAARVQRTLFYRAAGRQKEARTELDALMPGLRDRAKRRPRDLVLALQALAMIKGDEGRQADAAAFAREALALADRQLGEADPLGAGAALLLARALHQDRQADAALAAAEDALRRAERAWPADAAHPKRVEARMLFGRTLAEAGRLERGLAEMSAALDATRTLFGTDSLEAAAAAQSLVAYQVDRGLLREANANADEALRVMLRLNIRRSYNVGAAFAARGVARLAARRDADARDYLVIASQTIGVMIGHDHPATRLVKAQLAQALLSVEGVALATDAVRDLDAGAPPGAASQSYEAATWRVKAVAERMLGHAQPALALLDRAAARVVPGHRAPLERAAIDNERGRALLDLGRAADAAKAFDAARAAVEAAGSLPQPLLADAQVGLGRARLALGDAAGALQPLQAADAFWQRFDADNPWATEALFWFARASHAVGGPGAAEVDARLAHAVGRAPPGGHAALAAIRAAP